MEKIPRLDKPTFVYIYQRASRKIVYSLGLAAISVPFLFGSFQQVTKYQQVVFVFSEIVFVIAISALIASIDSYFLYRKLVNLFTAGSYRPMKMFLRVVHGGAPAQFGATPIVVYFADLCADGVGQEVAITMQVNLKALGIFCDVEKLEQPLSVLVYERDNSGPLLVKTADDHWIWPKNSRTVKRFQ